MVMVLIEFWFDVLKIEIESESSSQLPRSVSDPLREIPPELSRKSNDKQL